jgi:hypothetical protein
MSCVTREQLTAILGPLDDRTAIAIIATGAAPEEIAEAQAWLSNDEALVNAGRPLPGDRIARVIDILAAEEKERQSLTRNPAPSSTA